nr:transposase [Streptomyces sp. NRRL S-813]
MSDAKAQEVPVDEVVDDALIQQLMARAKDGGMKLAGEGGLLQQLTKKLLESALEGEITDHLGHEKGERVEVGRRENYRNGHRAKTVTTDIGAVEIEVPRDRAGTQGSVVLAVGPTWPVWA